MNAPTYLSPDQVAAMLPGISRNQLAQLRFRGEGPPYRKPTPRTVLYVEDEVLEWVESTRSHHSASSSTPS